MQVLQKKVLVLGLAAWLFVPISTRSLMGEVKDGKPVAINSSSTIKTGTEWPWWCGPNRTGHAEPQLIPTTWSETENVLWKAEVPGRGHSSPIVSNGNIYLTSADEGTHTISLFSYEFETGRKRWATVIQAGDFATIHKKNSHASATPACDGSRLFAAHIDNTTLYVTALDQSGNILWKQTVGPFHSEHLYGSAPALHESLVIVNGDSVGSAYIAGLNCETGQVAWKTLRDPHHENGSYATPLVVELRGRPQVLLSGLDHVTSYDPLTGKQIWVQDPYVIASGGWPEMKILGIRAPGAEVEGTAEVLWRATKGVAYVPTPLIHDQSALLLAGGGACSDYDLQTGKLNWQERLDGEYSASIVKCGDFYLVPNEAGVTTVFRLTPRLEKVSQNKLADAGGMASPTICHNKILLKILLRTNNYLYCIGLPQGNGDTN